MINNAEMEVGITLHQIYIAEDLLWENGIDLVHNKNIYFCSEIYLLSVECCSAAK